MENTIIHLIGFAGVGKYTIANELVARTNARLVDNHLINNPIFSVIDLKNGGKLEPDVWEQTRIIRNAVLHAMTHIAPREYSFVMTNVLYEHDPEDKQILEQMNTLAAHRGGKYVPIHLFCNLDENIKRFTNPNRSERLKPTNPVRMSERHAEYKLANIDHLPHAFKLDVSNLTPQQASDAIIAYIETIK